MNNLLELKGKFEQRNNPNASISIPTLRKGVIIKEAELEKFQVQLNEILDFWNQNKLINGVLISVKYNKLVAKSNRISTIFKDKTFPNDKVVGAKYSKDTKHIITYYLTLETLKQTIEDLNCTKSILKNFFDGSMDIKRFENQKLFSFIDKKEHGICKSKFRGILSDIQYIEKFTIEEEKVKDNNDRIVTLYKTDIETQKLLESIGINVLTERILDETTVLLGKDDLRILNREVPYLISMSVIDFNESYLDEFNTKLESQIDIPTPKNEPTIGVIDTLFDKRVYFEEWVEYEQRIDENIPIDNTDYRHGTAVSSIIVDGPRMNPSLEDGCGRFKVKHFGVALNRGFSSFTIVREIEKIIIKNRNIKVWNISLGSNEEIHNNFISAEAAMLDKIQYENDVIFVVAGTNRRMDLANKKIGAPADSINSLVVNSVEMSTKKSTTYTREGLVLSFFIKPDVSYYGGSKNEMISVCEPLGLSEVAGTSYAAPWISRKLSYLIDVLGFNREVAKALIIDSAIGWDQNKDVNIQQKQGHGIVPIHIDDIVKSKDEEIKFVVSGTSELYDTYNYRFPVPLVKDKYPFTAKATLCYFPKCSRTQGVDYTNTELDIKFGRIGDDKKIKSIDTNKQGEADLKMYEKDARKLFRKWDTVKHITDKQIKSQAKKSYDNKLWGLNIQTKERLASRDGIGIRFGVIITLKELNGINRIEDFIQQCSLNGWIVNRIDIENQIEMYQKVNEEIIFE